MSRWTFQNEKGETLGVYEPSGDRIAVIASASEAEDPFAEDSHLFSLSPTSAFSMAETLSTYARWAEKASAPSERRPTTDPVSFPSDDAPDDEDNVRLHILAHDDYYVAIGSGYRFPADDAVRLCTHGARDDGATFAMAALYKYGNGDLEGAIGAATAFIQHVTRTRGMG